MPSALARATHRLRRFVETRRRWLAAGFAAAAVASGLYSVTPPPAPTDTILVAAGDLTAGSTLRAEQVETARLPRDLVPDGALSQVDAVAGRVLAAPVREGEPLTDVRLLGGALLEGYGHGRVAAPVRIADPGAAALLRTGDRVDVLAADPQGNAETAVVAPDARVVVVPDADEAATHGASGALVVLAVPPDTARNLAQAAVVGPLSVSIRG